MKTLLYTLILFIVTCVVSCSNNEQNTTTQTENNTDNNVAADSIAKINADSIAKIEAIEKAKADSIAKAKADSLEKINNPHPDLKLFDLRGPVKSCKKGTKDYYRTLNFAESGELTHVTGCDKGKYKIHRKNGKISKIAYNEHDLISGWYEEFTTDNMGHIKQTDGADQDCGYEDKFQRNEKNLITKRVAWSGCGEGDDDYTTTNYSNYQFDKYGNWIRRTAKTEYGSNIETRTITYY